MPNLKELQDKIFKQDETITDLGEKHHELELKLCKVIGTLTKIDESQVKLNNQIIKHIDEEAAAVIAVHNRINLMDSELKESFKTRDEKIVDLQIESAKVNTRQLIYATIAFTIITGVSQIIIGIIS